MRVWCPILALALCTAACGGKPRRGVSHQEQADADNFNSFNYRLALRKLGVKPYRPIVKAVRLELGDEPLPHRLPGGWRVFTKPEEDMSFVVDVNGSDQGLSFSQMSFAFTLT